MSERLQALRSSVERLRSVAERIDPARYESAAYPSEWSIADTFSHIGSGAVISKRRFDDSVGHREPDPAFNPSVWDEWNAKTPSQQVSEAIVADAALLECLEGATAEERAEVHFAMGPFNFDFDGLLALRLGEHAVHTWDIEVTVGPAATIPNDTANAMLDSIAMIVTFTAKPTGETTTMRVSTNDPARDFELTFTPESVGLSEVPHSGTSDLELPAEALVRLIYGRLDSQHSPVSLDEGPLAVLRTVFPGF